MTVNMGMVSSASSFDQIENRGMDGSPLKQSFNSMDMFAKDLPFNEIVYLID
jgi:hypothetical protein